jgi:acyl carrier protein
MEVSNRDELIKDLIDLVVDAVNLQHLNKSKLSADTFLIHNTSIDGDDSLGLDSVDILEVVVTIEHRYGVKIKNAEQGQHIFKTFGTIADYLSSEKTL